MTSAATPRQIERVPAGSVFEGFELIYNIYAGSRLTNFSTVLTSLQLLEEDYLGGLGARGGGKVSFEINDIWMRKGRGYTEVICDLDSLRAGGKAIGVSDELRQTVDTWVAGQFVAKSR